MFDIKYIVVIGFSWRNWPWSLATGETSVRIWVFSLSTSSYLNFRIPWWNETGLLDRISKYFSAGFSCEFYLFVTGNSAAQIMPDRARKLRTLMIRCCLTDACMHYQSQQPWHDLMFIFLVLISIWASSQAPLRSIYRIFLYDNSSKSGHLIRPGSHIAMFLIKSKIMLEYVFYPGQWVTVKFDWSTNHWINYEKTELPVITGIHSLVFCIVNIDFIKMKLILSENTFLWPLSWGSVKQMWNNMSNYIYTLAWRRALFLTFQLLVFVLNAIIPILNIGRIVTDNVCRFYIDACMYMPLREAI